MAALLARGAPHGKGVAATIRRPAGGRAPRRRLASSGWPGFLRRFDALAVAADTGRRRLLRGLIEPNNAAADVRADSAARSARNGRHLRGTGKLRRIDRRKPPGRPILARAWQQRFAQQKGAVRPVLRSIRLERASAAATQAGLAWKPQARCDPRHGSA